jgi:hypothetical protein
VSLYSQAVKLLQNGLKIGETTPRSTALLQRIYPDNLDPRGKRQPCTSVAAPYPTMQQQARQTFKNGFHILASRRTTLGPRLSTTIAPLFALFLSTPLFAVLLSAPPLSAPFFSAPLLSAPFLSTPSYGTALDLRPP